MKRNQLEELIRHITRKVIKEYTVMSSSTDKTGSPTTDPAAPPVDAMTSLEKAKAEREADKERLKTIRTADMDLKGVKKQSDYFNQQVKQNKLEVTAKEKELQNLRAGKQISTGGAGSISA
jgi:hypothetical protein